VVDDVQALPGAEADAQLLIEGVKLDKQLVDARAMALENPQAVANILRTWVNGDDA
jgi:flagellar biosynthesis/type III secretory pathway M-ring protein FliF/YscJ